MSRRYAITKVLARSRVRLVRNPDPTAKRGLGKRELPRFAHGPTDGKQSQHCPFNVAFGNRCSPGATSSLARSIVYVSREILTQQPNAARETGK